MMNKFAYYPEDQNICHYLYIGDDGKVAYEQYSIDQELMTDSLDDLSETEKREWLLKAYEAEEKMVDEEDFLDAFTEHFDIEDS